MLDIEMANSSRSRLKREECKSTKHDSNFSRWKILIGDCDWEEHSKGKEGCERYRFHNLPQETCPGVYELGLGRERERERKNIVVVVVYLGQAENVRTRLQRYGRTGAHLDHSSLQQVFSQGFSILFRWAPMQSREDALLTEAQLLNTFDYAWNTSNNGIRRPHDILQKLQQITSPTKTLSHLATLLLPFTHNRVGIPIKSIKLPLPDEADNATKNFLSRVFTFNRSRPRILQHITSLVQEHKNTKICGVVLPDGSVCTTPPPEKMMRCPIHQSLPSTHICGIILSDASTCTRQPVIGRKRCHEHKGMRIRASNGYRYQNVSHDVQDPPQALVDESITNTNICGIILTDGSTCTRQPVIGRKRCHEHKGMRIRASNGYRYQNMSHDVQDPPQALVDGSITNTNICGIILTDGSTCTRQPVKGRKRCHEHKGMRIRASFHINQK